MRTVKLELLLLVGLCTLTFVDSKGLKRTDSRMLGANELTKDLAPKENTKDLLDSYDEDEDEDATKDLPEEPDEDQPKDTDPFDLRRLINPPETRIVGGSEVDLDDERYRFQVSLQKGSSNFPFCGGTLIHPNWVLTAGHCVARREPDRMVIGNYNLAKKNAGTIRKVRRIVKHPSYSGVVNDIALIELTQPVRNIVPIVLNREVGTPPETVGLKVSTMGWGYTSEGSGVVQDRLRIVDVPIQSQQKCSKSYSGIDDRNICAGYDEGKLDSCSGDSGGPLFHYDAEAGFPTQVGIVSYGRGCARRNYYGVYARVSAFLNFIEDTLADNGDELPSQTSKITPAPSQAPTRFEADTPEEQREYDYCILANNQKICRKNARGSRCFWNNANGNIVPDGPRRACLPKYMGPTNAPTPAPTVFEPITSDEKIDELSFCQTRRARDCNSGKRKDRCFWNRNKAKGGIFDVSYLANKCLPNFFINLFAPDDINRGL